MDEPANLSMVIDQICREKNISREVLIETVEQAVLAAAKRVFCLLYTSPSPRD